MWCIELASPVAWQVTGTQVVRTTNLTQYLVSLLAVRGRVLLGLTGRVRVRVLVGVTCSRE